MAINIPARLRDEDFATCLVKRYLAPDPATRRARYSGAHFERMGGGEDRPEAACQFTAEDLLAITMLGVRTEGYHALEVLITRPASSTTCSPRSRRASLCNTPGPGP